MKNTFFETLVGAVVIAVAAYFLVTAALSGGDNDADYYQLTAEFDRVDGLRVGSDVRVSGLPVGKIVGQKIDPKTYLAVITLEVDEEVGIPSDSTAEIIGDGLLGSKYVAVIPGGASDMLQDGDKIAFTQSAISIESLIGKFIFNSDDEEAKTDGKAAPETGEDTSIDDIF